MFALSSFIFSLIYTAIALMAGPWCFIWAINTLVSAGGVTSFFIPFTFWTWLAAVVIGGISILPIFHRSRK